MKRGDFRRNLEAVIRGYVRRADEGREVSRAEIERVAAGFQVVIGNAMSDALEQTEHDVDLLLESAHAGGQATRAAARRED